ncbi:MAG: hypothetical protein HOP13_05930 [Alphaproteobacteria bacterium]|nr:hypothetical protein [Alphaproteobacteria bacterium]
MAKDGQSAMEEYEAKRSAAYANAERLRELRQARDVAAADAGKAVAKKAIPRKAAVVPAQKLGT